MKLLSWFVQLLAYVWASPYSLFGLGVGMLGIATGGRGRIRGRVLEFYGALTSWFVRKLPDGEFVLAITLGHVILGQSGASLDVAREHEMIHVRQYERWGLLFGPAYLLCSFVLWLRGGRAYRDNPFERQAFDEGGGE